MKQTKRLQNQAFLLMRSSRYCRHHRHPFSFLEVAQGAETLRRNCALSHVLSPILSQPLDLPQASPQSLPFQGCGNWKPICNFPDLITLTTPSHASHSLSTALISSHRRVYCMQHVVLFYSVARFSSSRRITTSAGLHLLFGKAQRGWSR